MSGIVQKIKMTFIYELPIIKIYSLLYFAGVVIGSISAVMLRSDFSDQANLLFSSENSPTLFTAFAQQGIFFLIIFLLGLTVVGMPLIPLYPLYKGFSFGLLIALAVILSGVRGFVFGTLAFFAPNLLYTVLGYFLCYSSTRLSISLFGLLKGEGKHGGSYREFKVHIVCFAVLIPFLFLGAFWESHVVPLFLNLF